MKENCKNNNNNYNPKTLDRNKKSLAFNLNKLKKDINDMSSSLNNHIGKVEKKVIYKNLNF